jgi:hypothetical protein
MLKAQDPLKEYVDGQKYFINCLHKKQFVRRSQLSFEIKITELTIAFLQGTDFGFEED